MPTSALLPRVVLVSETGKKARSHLNMKDAEHLASLGPDSDRRLGCSWSKWPGTGDSRHSVEILEFGEWEIGDGSVETRLARERTG